MDTSSTSGNISTQYFDNKFDLDKLDGYIYIGINVHVPSSVKDGNNVTLMFNVKKKTMKEVSEITFCYETVIDAEAESWSRNITAPDSKFGFYNIELSRDVSEDDMMNMKLETMPGFRFSWNYDTEVEPQDKYSNEETTKEFVR